MANELHRQIAFLIFLCSLALVICIQDPAKCSDSRKYEYTRCYLHYSDRALWCDSTNVTTIPNPDQVPGNVISSKHAKILFANKSCINDISLDSMKVYTHLLKFDCSESLVKKLQNNAFMRCSKLKELDFTKNYIKHISKHHLHGTHQLEKLVLVENELESIGHKCFHCHSHLKILHLCRNRLTKFRSSIFPTKCSLDSLKVSHNAITNWMKPQQEQFTKLTELDLSFNNIVKLCHTNFVGMITLRYLNLNHNLISSLSRDTFVDMELLESLDLRNNRLSRIHKYMFLKNCQLKSLLLSGNQLQIPHFLWFIAVLSLNHNTPLSNALDNNKWSCNCTTLDYWNFLSKSNENITNYLDIKCSKPTIFGDRKLSSLDYEELNFAQCQNETNQNNISPSLYFPAAYEKMCPDVIPSLIVDVEEKRVGGGFTRHFLSILSLSSNTIITLFTFYRSIVV